MRMLAHWGCLLWDAPFLIPSSQAQPQSVLLGSGAG
jgi:hypothetical protein